jgi:endonuclease/exonuclease/phosphatase family metal-dependent hydrolase
MRSRLRLRPQHLYLIEATLVGVFFIQAFRFLIGIFYSHVSGAVVVSALDPASINPATPGVVDPSVVSSEITLLVYMLALPALTLLLGRARWFIAPAVVLTAVGRALMNVNTALSPAVAAALAVGGGLVYITMVIRYRAQTLPYLFILSLGIDQVFRAVGNTLDPSWSAEYGNIQIGLSVLAVVLSFITVSWQGREARQQETVVSPDRGLLPFWGGIGLGAMLFLELSLLALPNAIAGRSDVDYTTFVPLMLVATLLPLIPWVRGQARAFLAVFDGGARGWLWMLLIGLLFVFGLRFQGLPAGIAMVVAQFGISLIWWWLVRPQAEKEHNFSGLWVIAAVVIFALLAVGDFFTYEYAYVRNFTGNLTFLNNVIPPLLRGFRGMGLGVLLLGVFLAALPMTQTRRRIPWTEGTGLQSLLGLIFVILMSAGAAYAARPPLVSGVGSVASIRVGTYNIHNGYNEFFDYDLEALARTIQQSGANVVLLQQVEGGRMVSFGVDQPLWLARRLGMDRRFYPTNEGLQGLAVLSNVPIAYDDGTPLTSAGSQTGLQRVQIQPDNNVVITLYNTWLEFLLETPGARPVEEQEQEQEQQLNEIFSIIAVQHPNGVLGRTVIGGTFNNVPDSPLADQMRQAQFDDSFAGQPADPSMTLWRTGVPHARLDYLWLRNLTRISAGVMDSNASDHRMAVVEIQVTRRTQ